MNKITLTIGVLEAILIKVKGQSNGDRSNGMVEIEQVTPAKYHNTSDNVKVYLQSNYAECNSKFICQDF